MSPVAKFMLRPRVNLTGAGVSALGEVISWFTTLDDQYRATPILFGFTCVFLVLFALNEHLAAEKLRASAKPALRLVFGSGQIYDSLHHRGLLRIFRVGIVNSGETVANVAIKLALVRDELPRVFPMQEFQQTHEEDGVSRFTVNKSDEPLVFVDVIHQKLYQGDGAVSGSIGGVPFRREHKKGELHRMSFAFADGHRSLARDSEPVESFDEQYLIWLVIDGAGAEASRKFVLRLNPHGQYDMSEAFA